VINPLLSEKDSSCIPELLHTGLTDLKAQWHSYDAQNKDPAALILFILKTT
jgi:hypothetical protein